jgi:nucleoside-diphosphate-sugar epimerase
VRVWVSGSSGKLGSEVCRLLVAAGHMTVGADLRNDESPVDLLDRSSVAASLRGVDAIIHCAAIPRPGAGVDPADLVQINTMSTFDALEEAWKAGIRIAVLASSGSIYRTAWSPQPTQPAYIPVDENSPLDYVDPYALTKDFLERMGRMFARRGMTVTALRLHWLLTRSEARDAVDSQQNRSGEDAYQCLVIAAGETLATRPTAELITEHCRESELHRPIAVTTVASIVSEKKGFSA